jgi:hypothetical protein
MLLNQEFGFLLNDNPSSLTRVVRPCTRYRDAGAGIIRGKT